MNVYVWEVFLIIIILEKVQAVLFTVLVNKSDNNLISHKRILFRNQVTKERIWRSLVML